MRKKIILSCFLLFFVISSGIVFLKGKAFSQTSPFIYIKPVASSISLFIVADTLLAPEAEALILSLGGTVVSAVTNTSPLPSSGNGVQIHQVSFSLSPTAPPPAEFIQFTATFPDYEAACPILSSSPAVCFVGIIISSFYGTATGLIQKMGGSLLGQGTHSLIDEETGETICLLNSANPFLLNNYPGALVGPVTVSGTVTPLVEWFPPYYIMNVDDVTLSSPLTTKLNIPTPFITGFDAHPFLNNLPFLNSLLNQPYNFINPGSVWGINFMPSLFQFMPFSWPGIIPWHNPFTPPGIQQAVFTTWAAGYEQESPYYQQNFNEIYSPAYAPGIGTVYPYQSIYSPSIFNPLSLTGYISLIPAYGFRPNIF